MTQVTNYCRAELLELLNHRCRWLVVALDGMGWDALIARFVLIAETLTVLKCNVTDPCDLDWARLGKSTGEGRQVYIYIYNGMTFGLKPDSGDFCSVQNWTSECTQPGCTITQAASKKLYPEIMPAEPTQSGTDEQGKEIL